MARQCTGQPSPDSRNYRPPLSLEKYTHSGHCRNMLARIQSAHNKTVKIRREFERRAPVNETDFESLIKIRGGLIAAVTGLAGAEQSLRLLILAHTPRIPSAASSDHTREQSLTAENRPSTPAP